MQTPRPPTLYDALALGSGASPAQIREAYRRLAAQCHPDRGLGPDAQERMAGLNRAYSVLSDPVQRAAYDLTLRQRAPAPVASGAQRRRRLSGPLLWALPALAGVGAIAGAGAAYLAQPSERPPLHRDAAAAVPPFDPDAPLSLIPARQLQAPPAAPAPRRPAADPLLAQADTPPAVSADAATRRR